MLRYTKTTVKAITADIDRHLGEDFVPTADSLRHVIETVYQIPVIESATLAADPRFVAQCHVEPGDREFRATIYLRPQLAGYWQLRALLHELAEYLAVKLLPNLFDLEATAASYSGTVDETEYRHHIATTVEQQYVARWKLSDSPTVSRDFLPVLADAWRKTHPPVADLELVDNEVVL